MKKLVLFFALFLSLTITANAGNGQRDLMNRITKQLGFSAAEKAQLGTGVAVVTFTIDQNGLINVIQCDATTEAQKTAVMSRLSNYYMQNVPVTPGATYMMKIDFSKQ
jgi:hypothetical protein